FYNKDIFDRFSADYPQDGMTWEETIELAEEVSRSDGGQVYYGLQYSNSVANFARGLAMPLVHPKTDLATLNTEKGLKVLQTLKKIYSIPGNEFAGGMGNGFLTGGTAMVPYWLISIVRGLEQSAEAGDIFNWDVT